jgi:hypothetical protein
MDQEAGELEELSATDEMGELEELNATIDMFI